MEEQELIRKLAAGQEDAYRHFIREHEEKIFALCIGFLHNREDAEDLCQEVFLELFNSIAYFKGNSSLTTWVYRIAVNKSLNSVKRKKRILFYNKLLGKAGLAEKNSPDKNLEKKELSEILFRTIENLPENQRIAYTLAKYDDMSYEEIAGIMDVSLSSVESLMFRAKENLKKKLLTYYEKNFKDGAS